MSDGKCREADPIIGFGQSAMICMVAAFAISRLEKNSNGAWPIAFTASFALVCMAAVEWRSER